MPEPRFVSCFCGHVYRADILDNCPQCGRGAETFATPLPPGQKATAGSAQSPMVTCGNCHRSYNGLELATCPACATADPSGQQVTPSSPVPQQPRATSIAPPADEAIASPPPGWYMDSADKSIQRYWTGHEWTEHRRPAPPTTATQRTPTAATVLPPPGRAGATAAGTARSGSPPWARLATALLAVMVLIAGGIAYSAAETNRVFAGHGPYVTYYADGSCSSIGTGRLAPAECDAYLADLAKDAREDIEEAADQHGWARFWIILGLVGIVVAIGWNRWPRLVDAMRR